MSTGNNRYADIIDLPHYKDPTRKTMTDEERAAQFAPFDALTGYDEAIEETGRTTENETSLSEQEIEELNLKFRIIEEHLKEHPSVIVRYFVPDQYKEGGYYKEEAIIIRKIDLSKRIMISEDKREFDLDYIRDIRSDVISRYFDNYL